MSGKQLLFWGIIVMVQFVLVVAMISPAYLQKTQKEELKTLVKWFGKEKTKNMYSVSKENFEGAFLETGAVQGSYKLLLPNKKPTGNRGVDRMSKNKVWGYIENRLDAFWSLVRSVFLRFELLMISLLHCIPFLIPAFVDGLMKREITKCNVNNASTIMYTTAKQVFNFCLLGPFILFFLPLSLSPTYVGMWALLLAASSWLMASNVQLRVY